MDRKCFSKGFSALIAATILFTSGLASADRPARKKVIAACKTTITLPNSSFIYKNSAPLRSGGVGTPLVGYRIEPTLIMNKRYTRSSMSIYGLNGNVIGRCPWASAHGHAGGRARCSMNTKSLRSSAIRNGKKPTVIFKVNSNLCVQVTDAGRCYGSVKGLCNRKIS